MRYFDRQMKINATQKETPIVFSHKYSFNRPENHTLHLNQYLEIYIFVSGAASYIIEDTHYSLTKGDVLLISPHEVHVAVLNHPCAYERFYLLIPLDTFLDYRCDPLLPLLTKPANGSARLSFPPEKQDCLFSILQQLSELCEADYSESGQLLAHALTLQLLCFLSAGMPQQAIPSLTEETGALPKLLKDVLHYICTVPGEISSVGDIAEHFHISLPYLSALFKKHIGVTAGAYLRTKKVALAKQLLEEGSTVTDACYESGFCDCSYFIKIFKECIGVTPHRYKMMFMKKSL